jgi:hypothetical protein
MRTCERSKCELGRLGNEDADEAATLLAEAVDEEPAKVAILKGPALTVVTRLHGGDRSHGTLPARRASHVAGETDTEDERWPIRSD